VGELSVEMQDGAPSVVAVERRETGYARDERVAGNNAAV
jgi:hypothetical protein